jgi:hypothetical protein
MTDAMPNQSVEPTSLRSVAHADRSAPTTMPFTRVDQLSEIAPLLDDCFNPPQFTRGFTKDAWEQEYGAVHEQIFECLQQAEAEMTGIAEEAFSMGDPFSQDRVVCVVVTYIDLLSSELLRQLQRILAATPQDYRIIIDGSDRNGKQYYIAITEHDTIAYAHNPSSLSTLGFNSPGAEQ